MVLRVSDTRDVEWHMFYKPEQLTGYPVFPEGTKSLLCKNLSRELWNELKDTKDAHGVTFK